MKRTDTIPTIIFIITFIICILLMRMLPTDDMYYTNTKFVIFVIITAIEISYSAYLIAIRIGNTKRYDSHIKKIDYEYYREFITNYSVYTLCQCYGKKVDVRDQMVATMIKLIIEKKISIENDRIKLLISNFRLNEKNQFLCSDDLTDSENFTIRYLLNSDLKEDKQLIAVESYSDETFSTVKKVYYVPKWKFDEHAYTDLFISKKNYRPSVDTTQFFGLFSAFGTAWCGFNSVIFMPYFGTILFILTGTLAMFSNYIINDKYSYIRTEKGNIVRGKLLGLKRFLKEFSNIKESDIEGIKLWDYYIIYAIIFNLKGNLDNDVIKSYKKYIAKNI